VTALFADAVHSMDIVEALLDRGAEVDVVEADGVISRLEAAPAEGSVIRDIWVLRLRALLARARGDETGYREHRDRYRALATSLGFEGHKAMS
jgi:adenylate cyclase